MVVCVDEHSAGACVWASTNERRTGGHLQALVLDQLFEAVSNVEEALPVHLGHIACVCTALG
jgi:hypothetical protein